MSYLIAICLLPPALITLCFAIELFFGLLPIRRTRDPEVNGARGVIIVPAHDEAKILAPRLNALKSAIEPIVDRISILIVADNCADATADVARSLGVTVIERFDETLRGKGYALDFARQWLAKDPPDVVMIVDADCSIDSASIDDLLSVAKETGSPCQAINLQRSRSGASAPVQVSTFAFFVKNVIRQRALTRLAGRTQLLGTGMALPWTLFVHANLATPSIVEDIKLGYELAEAGHPPILVEGATVWSDAETTANTLAQRRRWEGGFLKEALLQGPARFVRSVKRADAGGIWAALSIMIPPVALLVLVDTALLLIAALIIWVAGIGPFPLLILAMPMLLAGFGLVAAWFMGGSSFLSVGALVRAPLYVFWKLPMYLGFWRRGAPQHWVRTDRSQS